MTVRLLINGENVPLKQLTFSDGASTVQLLERPKLRPIDERNYYAITVEPTTLVDRYLIELLLLASALSSAYLHASWDQRIINLPYLPYGRADRIFEDGDASPLHMFFNALSHAFPNAQINVQDPHSLAYAKWIGYYHFDARFTSQATLFKYSGYLPCFQKDHVLIAPDKGAQGKIVELQTMIGQKNGLHIPVIEAGKTRDLTTGRVTGTTLPADATHVVGGRTCWIIDDIADGGGTFIPLAQKLREAGATKVILYVTHGIFAKGLEPFKGIIDEIYVNQIIVNYISKADLDAFNGVQYIVN